MTFEAYQTANLAKGRLQNPISAATNTLILQTGQGDLFPDVFPYPLEINHYDSSSTLENKPVLKREIILVFNKVDDTFTILRSADYCPASDTALEQTNTAFSFDAGDTVFLTNTSLLYKDIQEEIERLEDDKLNASGGLRSGMGTWKLIYTNGSGNEIALALGSNGQYLRSNGATSAPSFGAPPLDVNSQTTVTIATGDFLALADVSDSNNTKKGSVSDLVSLIRPTVDIIQQTRDISASSGSVSYTHSLGVVPKQITIQMMYGQNTESNGAWVPLKNYCNYVNGATVGANAVNIVQCDGNHTGAISAVSSSDITIDRVKIGSPSSSNMYLLITLIG